MVREASAAVPLIGLVHVCGKCFGERPACETEIRFGKFLWENEFLVKSVWLLTRSKQYGNADEYPSGAVIACHRTINASTSKVLMSVDISASAGLYE